jgi:uncharacterized protein (DUF924 family)
MVHVVEQSMYSNVVDIGEEEDVDDIVDQLQRVVVLDALPRNLITGTSCRFSSSRRWLRDTALP